MGVREQLSQEQSGEAPGYKGEEHKEHFPVQNAEFQLQLHPTAVGTPRTRSGAAEQIPVPAAGPELSSLPKTGVTSELVQLRALAATWCLREATPRTR